MTTWLGSLGVAVVVISGFAILVIARWRAGIGALSLLYVGVTLLVSLAWPFELAVVKLVAGWMAVAVLGSFRFSRAGVGDLQDWPTGGLFRFLTGGLVLMAVYSIVPFLLQWLPFIPPMAAYGGVFLIAIGLIKLGLSSEPSWVIVALFIILAGFEIIYAMVEDATLVVGMLAALNLGLGLLGAYFQALMDETPTGGTA